MLNRERSVILLGHSIQGRLQTRTFKWNPWTMWRKFGGNLKCVDFVHNKVHNIAHIAEPSRNRQGKITNLIIRLEHSSNKKVD